MAITKVRHIPRIIVNPPRSVKTGKMQHTLNEKTSKYNRSLAGKSPLNDKSKKASPALSSVATTKKKIPASSIGKKKPLSPSEKALKTLPKLSKPHEVSHKKPTLAAGKKLGALPIKKKPAFTKPKSIKEPKIAKDLPKGPLDKKIPPHNLKTVHSHNLPPQLHVQADKDPSLHNLADKRQKKTNFGKLKQKAIFSSNPVGKQKRIHKSFLSHVKPPDNSDILKNKKL